MLHITNGDSTVNAIREATRDNNVMPWRDILHEGPTPAGLTLEKMSDVRARFLADWASAKYKETRREMGVRDAALLSAPEITLWFEHDLYDQLQLIQILSALAGRKTEVQLICTNQYLGPMHAGQMAELWKQRAPVSVEQFSLGNRAWVAFCSPDRSALDELLTQDLSALPFLADALRRHMDDFPSEVNGLSRTDRQILEAVNEGAQNLKKIFWAFQAKEQARFMGDTTLDLHIKKLTKVRKPLLTAPPITLTEVGRKVLAGELNQIQLNGLDRWHGGVHLKR
jgi:hypothetical protein